MNPSSSKLHGGIHRWARRSHHLSLSDLDARTGLQHRFRSPLRWPRTQRNRNFLRRPSYCVGHRQAKDSSLLLRKPYGVCRESNHMSTWKGRSSLDALLVMVPDVDDIIHSFSWHALRRYAVRQKLRSAFVPDLQGENPSPSQTRTLRHHLSLGSSARLPYRYCTIQHEGSVL